jgi:hypothetical protein
VTGFLEPATFLEQKFTPLLLVEMGCAVQESVSWLLFVSLRLSASAVGFGFRVAAPLSNLLNDLPLGGVHSIRREY